MKTCLAAAELVKLSQHDLGIGIALEFVNQSHRLLEIALIAAEHKCPDALIVDEFRDPFLHAVAVLLGRVLR